MIPLVLLPGLVCDREVWAAQEQALGQDCSVYVMPHFYSHSSLAGMARAVLEMAPERFALAGHSMGGRVAFQIMAEAPERVERLALFSTGVIPASPEEPAKRQPMIDLSRAQGMAALAAAWLPMIVHPERLRELAFMDRLTAMICRASPEIYEGQVKALLTRPDFRPLLPTISCPTLVACGRQDLWSPLAQHREIAAGIPHAKLAIIEDSAHMVTVESPDAVSALLRNWMEL
jgi:pimeloyl-ACP methyl ester carboxylesterase